MTKISLACVLLIISGLTAQISYASDDQKELETALAGLQNSSSSGDLYGAISTFTYNDFTKLPPSEQKKAADLIFNVMDGTQKIPAGRMSESEVREEAVRAVGYALYSAKDKNLPSPIPDAGDRLINAATKSPDIANEAFETVLAGTNIGKGSQALESKQYQTLVDVATSNSNANVRAAALDNLANFKAGGKPTEQFVLSRLTADSSPKVKASILNGLSGVWLLDGVADPGQKSVQRILTDSDVQKTLIGGLDLSKKYDSMKDDASHPILCATIINYGSFADIGYAVNLDSINNKTLEQPTMGLLKSAIDKLESSYPQSTQIRCPERNMFGEPETAVYDTGKLDKLLNKVLSKLNEKSGSVPSWTVSCINFASAEQGASDCETPVKNALTNDNIGCQDVQVHCTSAPDAYCKVKSSNCSRANSVCPEKQIRIVTGDREEKICIASPSSSTHSGDESKATH